MEPFKTCNVRGGAKGKVLNSTWIRLLLSQQVELEILGTKVDAGTMVIPIAQAKRWRDVQGVAARKREQSLNGEQVVLDYELPEGAGDAILQLNTDMRATQSTGP